MFDTMSDIIILLDGIGIATNAVLGNKIQIFAGDFVTVECAQFPLRFKLPTFGPFAAALREEPVARYQIGVEPLEAVREDFQTTGLLRIAQRIYNAALLAFYERHREWVRNKYSGDVEKWPELFRFAWALRNAATHHDGILHITDPARRKVVWHHLSYDHQDAGKPVLGAILSGGDVLLLLFEMSDDLDTLGCPV